MRDDLPGKGARGKGRGRLYNRVASFFLYLEDDCVGGGTEFPDLNLNESIILAEKGRPAVEPVAAADADSARQDRYDEASEELEFWKERIEIERNDNEISGVIFKPRKGSGVFWVNLHESGFGDRRARHAGLPVQEGQKVGMNIWVKRDFGW
jgi:prolyl 4-hydroxylase